MELTIHGANGQANQQIMREVIPESGRSGRGGGSLRWSGRASGRRCLWGAISRFRGMVTQAEGMVCAKAWGSGPAVRVSAAGECAGRRVGGEAGEGRPSHKTMQAELRGSVLPEGKFYPPWQQGSPFKAGEPAPTQRKGVFQAVTAGDLVPPTPASCGDL